MYIPRSFLQQDPAANRRLIEENAFGLFVTTDVQGSPQISHLPWQPVFDGQDRLRLLQGHLARANPQAADLDAARSVVAVFQGPHAYISPRHYEADFAVPTWNYAVVHVRGHLRVQSDPEKIRSILDELVATYESAQGGVEDEEPWRADWQDERVEGLLNAIVAFEIEVEQVEAKFKLSQNRSERDQQTVARALTSMDHPDARQTGQLMLAGLGADGARPLTPTRADGGRAPSWPMGHARSSASGSG